jgi:hypothetical protein
MAAPRSTSALILGREPRRGIWLAPPAGSSKINVNVAVAKSTARGSNGVLCRSSEGNYLGSSAVVFDDVTCPRILESLACREGLDTADDLGVGSVLLGSDCLEVVKGLHGEDLGTGSSILVEIKTRAKQRGNITFVHEQRKCNLEAHNLARFASSLLVGHYVWFFEPHIDLARHVNTVID